VRTLMTLIFDQDNNAVIDQQYQHWLFALSAPMVALNVEHGATYESPQFYPDSDKIDLNDSWGIDNREQLLAMIVRMVDEGHADDLARHYDLWHRLSPSDWQQHCEGYPAEMQPILAMVAESAAQCGFGGIKAWDLARMSFLCRLGQLNGWLTAKENLWYHTRLAARARYYYSSWPQYFAGFMHGRSYWLVLNVEETESKDYLFSQLGKYPSNLGLMSELYSSPESPLSQLEWYVDRQEMQKPTSLNKEDWS